MVPPLRNKPKQELDNLHITYFWKPIKLLDTNAHLKLDIEDKLVGKHEDALQEWRINMEKIRNTH
jgi:hypothetical protein